MLEVLRRFTWRNIFTLAHARISAKKKTGQNLPDLFMNQKYCEKYY